MLRSHSEEALGETNSIHDLLHVLTDQESRARQQTRAGCTALWSTDTGVLALCFRNGNSHRLDVRVTDRQGKQAFMVAVTQGSLWHMTPGALSVLFKLILHLKNNQAGQAHRNELLVLPLSL